MGEEDDARLSRLQAQGLAAPHPLGEIELQRAVFTVQHPQAVRDRWQLLFGFARKASRGWRWAVESFFSVRARRTN